MDTDEIPQSEVDTSTNRRSDYDPLSSPPSLTTFPPCSPNVPPAELMDSEDDESISWDHVPIYLPDHHIFSTPPESLSSFARDDMSSPSHFFSENIELTDVPLDSDIHLGQSTYSHFVLLILN